MTRGYFAIGIYNSKTPDNLGTLWRSAWNFGAAYIFTIGKRYDRQPSDTINVSKHIPLFQYKRWEDFDAARPHDCPLIAVEQSEKSIDLTTASHPERAIYLLGAEDNGLSPVILKRCQSILHIPTLSCINVAVAGSIVMYDRKAKESK